MPKKKSELDEILKENIEDGFDEDVEEDIEDIPEEEGIDEEPLEEEGEGETFEEPAVSKEALKMTGDVPVQVVAVMGKKTISMKELIGLKMGEVIDLDRPPNEVVDLVAGGKLIAKGELVDIDGKLGVKIVKMVR